MTIPADTAKELGIPDPPEGSDWVYDTRPLPLYQAHREPMAHPAPDPMLPPDSARRDLKVVSLAIAVLVVLYWAAINAPPVPGQ